jgi:hypothetical protein
VDVRPAHNEPVLNDVDAVQDSEGPAVKRVRGVVRRLRKESTVMQDMYILTELARQRNKELIESQRDTKSRGRRPRRR